MGIFNERYRGEVILPQGYRLLSAESDTLDALGHEIGRELSQYTMEDGEDIPKGTVLKNSRVIKIGPVIVRRIALEEKTLA